MKTLSQAPPVLQRAIATYEAMRRLGFLPEALHVDTANTEEDGAPMPHVFVVLRLRDPATEKEALFPIDCGPAKDAHGPIVDLQARWLEAIGLWNLRETSAADKMRLWTKYMPRGLQDRLVMALAEFGVEIPLPPGGRH